MDLFKHKCFCGIEFKQKKNLYAHMRKQHDIEPLQPQIKMENYVCDLCGKKFICQSSIIRHLRRNHSDSNNKLIGVNKKISLMCPYGKCSENFRTYEILREHLVKKHYFQIKFEELTFNSIEGDTLHHQNQNNGFIHPKKGISDFFKSTTSEPLTVILSDDFDQWKDSMQLQTASLYTQSTAGRTLRIELGRRLYYNCHRSNVYNRRGNNVRAIKSLGSNKIGKACPSRLEVTYTPYAGQMIIKVNFWKTHCGHTNEIERLPLNRQMKCSIAEKLENGYTFKQILEWSRDTRIQDDVSERLQLLNEKDLYNIIREFNIRPVKKKRTPKKVNFKINRNSIIAGKSDSKNNISKVNDCENNKPSTSVSENKISTSIDNNNYCKNNVSTINASNSNKYTTSNSNNDKSSKSDNVIIISNKVIRKADV